MARIVKLEDREYDLDKISNLAQRNVATLRFIDKKLVELKNNRALLLKARQGYIDDIQQEILSKKAGLLLDND